MTGERGAVKYGGMIARGERRKRSAKCPQCGKLFSPQGLNGHLRFHHKTGGDEVTRQVAEATVTAGLIERVEHTQELVQRLLNARKMRKLLGEPGQDDVGARDCCEALEARELEILNEIRKLEGKRPLVPAVQRDAYSAHLFGSGPKYVEQGPENAPEPDE